MEGLITLLLFLLFLWEWPRFIHEHEARSALNPDPIEARIRMARMKAGLTPEPED